MLRYIYWLSLSLFLLFSCKKEKGTCRDGIKNNDEITVDCGGSCGECISCFDGIQNGNESGTDCGGPDCYPCATGNGSIICSGDGSDKYIPMTMFNSWYFRKPGVAGYTWTITGTQLFNSYTYYRFENHPLGIFRYLRKNSNGDIMRYDLVNGNELLYIPANPSINQNWSYTSDNSVSRKIVNLNATYSTLKCNYYGLLEIHNIDTAGNPSSIEYYHRGIGLISLHEIWMGISAVDLEQITLH